MRGRILRPSCRRSPVLPLSASGLGQIAAAVARFEAWLVEYFKPESVQREWPLLHVDAAGTVVSGMADLIVHTAEGAWIVDHKSDAIEDPVQAFLKYELQLQAYADAIAATGTTCRGCGGALDPAGGGCGEKTWRRDQVRIAG